MGAFAGGRCHCTLVEAALEARITVEELGNRVLLIMLIVSSEDVCVAG